MIITGFITSCNSVKRVAEDERLLKENSVYVNEEKDNRELIDNLLYQHPNLNFLGIPGRLHIYNSARPNIDSIINANIDKNPKRRARLEKKLSKKQLDLYIESRKNFNEWLKKTGQAPVIVNEERTEKSITNLKKYFYNNGWFNTEASYKVEEIDSLRANVDYFVETGAPYILDSITTKIATPIVDSLYQSTKENSLTKKGEQYKSRNFEEERERIASEMRNSGVFHFGQDYITFDLDTIGTNKKVNVEIIIKDRDRKSVV